MPIIKSAKKRVKVAAKASSRNARTKRALREALKSYSAALSGGKTAKIAKAQKAAVQALDIAAKKSIIHKNKAARKKSQIAAQAKASGVKPAKTTSKPKAVPTGRQAKSQKPRTQKPASTKRTTAPKPALSRTSVHK